MEQLFDLQKLIKYQGVRSPRIDNKSRTCLSD